MKIGIVGHVSRKTLVDDLANTTQATYVSIDDGTLGANANHRHVWTHLQGDHEWSVVLEDDAQPVDGFLEQAQAALEICPTDVASFYLGRQRPPQWQARITQAITKTTDDTCWITSTHLLHAVAVAVRTKHIPDMLANLKPYLPIDEAIGQWCRHKPGFPVAYTWPSLCGHNDTVPSLVKHRDNAPRPPGRTAWRTGTRTHWTDKATTL